VQKPVNEPAAQVPLEQSLSSAQASPMAPDEQAPPELPMMQRKLSAHWSFAEQAAPAFPSVHLPCVAPA
jgi:hypothetical protein